METKLIKAERFILSPSGGEVNVFGLYENGFTRATINSAIKKLLDEKKIIVKPKGKNYLFQSSTCSGISYVLGKKDFTIIII